MEDGGGLTGGLLEDGPEYGWRRWTGCDADADAEWVKGMHRPSGTGNGNITEDAMGSARPAQLRPLRPLCPF
jgi:hypothetical protein